MATVQEDPSRQTYGDAPGWSDRTTEGGAGASPTPDGEAASSAEELPVQEAPAESGSESTPPSTSPPEDASVPFHQHPRWIERQRELERERQEKEALRQQNQQLMDLVQRTSTPPAPIQEDIWKGKVDHADPATAQYWQTQRMLMEHHERQAEERAVKRLQPLIQSGMAKLAAIDLKEFRRENPEIQAGSPEERMIVDYMEGRVDGTRHTLDSARNNVVIRRLETENRALKAKQTAVSQKRAAANVESSSGIPAVSGLPGKTASSDERARAILAKGGSWKDTAAAFFGIR